MDQIELVIEGMTCDACARQIERALNALPGVEASVSYGSSTAAIRNSANVDRDALDRAVKDAGYRVARSADRQEGVGGGTELHIAVIGSGGGAFAAAIRAAESGARVTMIERGTLGGTCVNVGCVPSKILLRAAELNHRQRHHPFAGVPTGDGAVDRSALLGQLQGRVDELRQDKYERILTETDGIDLIQGDARFIDAGTLCVEQVDGETVHLAPDRILIATGASPTVPPIPGLTDTPWWTSADALFTDETPAHLAVIGASFVACEIAQAFRRLGSEVTLVARSRLLSYEAPEVGDALESAFEAEGIRVLREQQAQRIIHDGQRFTLELDDERVEADRLLVATGRTPNTAELDLDKAGVETDERGAIRIDGTLRTSADGIYAVGDCAAMTQLVYVAAATGTRAAVNMTGGDARLDLSVLPSVIFTDPQVAAVGLDEEQARTAGIETVSRRLELDQVPRALANFDTRGFVRLIAEAETGRLLGTRIVAHNGGEIIQSAALAIRADMTVDELAGELFPYLTLAESLKLCAQTFAKDVNKLSCCAG
jgi:mercuric reductase